MFGFVVCQCQSVTFDSGSVSVGSVQVQVWSKGAGFVLGVLSFGRPGSSLRAKATWQSTGEAGRFPTGGRWTVELAAGRLSLAL